MNVEAVLFALRAGDLSPEARRWLIEGLEAWQQGQDLESALGLHSQPLDRRDELLRVVLRLSPGGSDTARCAFLVECLDGRQHPSTMATHLLDKLQSSGVQLPCSVRHLARILNGSRRDSETENRVLCPDWPLPQTAENHRGNANDRKRGCCKPSPGKRRA